MVSNITKQSKSGGIDKVSKWRSPGRNIGVRVSELTGLDMVVTVSGLNQGPIELLFQSDSVGPIFGYINPDASAG